MILARYSELLEQNKFFLRTVRQILILTVTLGKTRQLAQLLTSVKSQGGPLETHHRGLIKLIAPLEFGCFHFRSSSCIYLGWCHEGYRKPFGRRAGVQVDLQRPI